MIWRKLDETYQVIQIQWKPINKYIYLYLIHTVNPMHAKLYIKKNILPFDERNKLKDIYEIDNASVCHQRK